MNTRIRYCFFVALGSLAASAVRAAAPDSPCMDKLDFEYRYRDRIQAGAEVSYDLQPNMQAFTRFMYESGDGSRSAPLAGCDHFGSLPKPRDPTPLEAELETRHSASDHGAFPVPLGAVDHFG